jgi:hypothetical protein
LSSFALKISDKSFGGVRCGVGVASIAMNQDQCRCTLRQERDLSCPFQGRSDVRFREQFRVPSLYRCLVPTRDYACRMTRQIGELHRQAGKSGPRPARLFRPLSELGE